MFASANRTGLGRTKESVWGTTPATPPITDTRYTGEALDNNISTDTSKEISPDRMVKNLIVVDASPNGSFNFELSYGTYDDLFESAFMSTWSTSLAIVSIAGDISTAVGASNNLTSTLGTKFNNIAVGQMVQLAGWVTNPSVNKIYRVTGKLNGGSITLSPAPGFAETPVGTTGKVGGQMLRNGITEQSYTLVKQLNDATVMTRQVFTGMRVKGFSLDMQTGSILTGVFNFVGKNGIYTEATFAGEATVPATNTEVLNCVTNMQSIFQNGALIGAPGSVMSLSLEFDNQHREQKGLGVLGNVGVVAGQLQITGNASQYFESKAQADMFSNSTGFAFSWVLQDNAGNTYVFTLPFCKYQTFTTNATGLDTDVMADTTFMALKDPTTLCAMQIDRFPIA